MLLCVYCKSYIICQTRSSCVIHAHSNIQAGASARRIITLNSPISFLFLCIFVEKQANYGGALFQLHKHGCLALWWQLVERGRGSFTPLTTNCFARKQEIRKGQATCVIGRI